MLFLVDGNLFTHTSIANAMELGIRYAEYWMDDIKLLEPERGVVRWGDPSIYAGDFKIQVTADNVTNNVGPEDIQFALSELNEAGSMIPGAIMDGTVFASQADTFFQLCVFGQVMYGL